MFESTTVQIMFYIVTVEKCVKISLKLVNCLYFSTDVRNRAAGLTKKNSHIWAHLISGMLRMIAQMPKYIYLYIFICYVSLLLSLWCICGGLHDCCRHHHDLAITRNTLCNQKFKLLFRFTSSKSNDPPATLLKRCRKVEVGDKPDG